MFGDNNQKSLIKTDTVRGTSNPNFKFSKQFKFVVTPEVKLFFYIQYFVVVVELVHIFVCLHRFWIC